MNDSLQPHKSHRLSLVARSISIWLILILAEIVHGMLRSIALVPLVGEFRSSQIGVFSGSAIILVIAYFAIHWIGAQRRSEQCLVGAIWLVLTVAFEVLFGWFVVGLSWGRLASDYNLLSGGMMPVGLAVLFFSPMIATRLWKSVFQRSIKCTKAAHER